MKMKSIALFLAFGMILGGVAVTLLMPSVLEWYFEPPTSVGISCAPSIAWAIDKFRWAQLSGLLVGAVLGLMIGLKFSKKKAPASVETN